jgi:pyruvate/2-oxoglutarate dehydrogenase complex dihydrolipoamide acyltransferase (E2) component
MSTDRDGEGVGEVVRVPFLNDSNTSGIVSRVVHPVGTRVRKDTPLFEIDLDKVCVEIVAPSDGVIASIAVQSSQEVAVDAPLCVLRNDDGSAVPLPTRPCPLVTTTRLRWDARNVRARGGETARLLVALVRALAAVPTLLDRPWPRHVVYCDYSDCQGRWIHGVLGPDLDVDAAQRLVRSGESTPREDWPAHVEVLRVQASAVGPMRTSPRARQLCVGVGPIRDEAVVDDGRIVVRPIAEIELALGTAVPADDLVVFAAAFAEQLAVV